MCTTHRKQMLSAGCASGLCPFSPRFLKEKKEHRKPVRWYTRLIVYGNPGRVVNGYAPGIPVLICGFGVVVHGAGCSGVLRRVDARPRSYRGTRPRFASGTLMSLRTTPPLRVKHQAYPERGSYTLRKRHQGTLSGALRSEARRERSAREGGFPCRSGGRV